MNDPKQLYLFNELEYDDMESDDYDEAYEDYLFALAEQTDDFTDESFD